MSLGLALKKFLTCVGGGEGEVGELDLMNVFRILAQGGSFCRVLRGSEALEGQGINHAMTPGGSAKEYHHVRGGRVGGGWAGII